MCVQNDYICIYKSALVVINTKLLDYLRIIHNKR